MRVFVSYVFEDREFVLQLERWASNRLLGPVNIIKQEQDIRIQGKDIVRQRVKDTLFKCDALLVLIGQDTHNHDWIRTEVELANSYEPKIPVICIRIPNTRGARPQILTNYQETEFKATALKLKLNNL